MWLLPAVLVLAFLAVPASALTPAPRVAFNAGLTDVVTVAPDGSDLRNLTPGTQASYSADLDPSWSPDGTRIAFDSHRDSNVSTEIYVMNADGSDQQRLTHDSGQNQIFNTQPLWSPRGDRIAFEKSVNGQNYDLWVMQPDGGGQRALTTDGGIKRDVSWSPDGTRLVYTQNESPGSRISTVGLDGAPPVALSPAGASDAYPAWSPDGSRIAFSAPRLTVMNADGSGRRTLTDIDTSGPVWSPDGTRIAFAGVRPFPQYFSARFGTPSRQDAFAIDTTGGNLRRLTGPFGDDRLEGPGGSQPTWWPDGSRLFYVDQRFRGPPAMFEMNADGTCQGRFAPDAPDLLGPEWQPGAGSLPPITRCAELRLWVAVANNPVALDEPDTVTFTVDNDGNLPATVVHVDVSTPDADAELSSSFAGCAGTAKTLTCSLDVIPPGGSAQVSITATRHSAGSYPLQAHVGAAERDTDPTNNDVPTGIQVLPCTLVGTYGNDVIYGTDGADRICGLPGSDTIYGRAGNDYIDAGNGDDKIYPGPGRDTVIARGGDDIVYARDGERDWIDCGAQRDIAIVDRIDVVRHCEYVVRPGR